MWNMIPEEIKQIIKLLVNLTTHNIVLFWIICSFEFKYNYIWGTTSIIFYPYNCKINILFPSEFCFRYEILNNITISKEYIDIIIHLIYFYKSISIIFFKCMGILLECLVAIFVFINYDKIIEFLIMFEEFFIEFYLKICKVLMVILKILIMFLPELESDDDTIQELESDDDTQRERKINLIMKKLENIEQISSKRCAVCFIDIYYEKPEKPCVLSCGHTDTCLKCADIIYNNHNKECPICRAVMNQPPFIVYGLFK